LGSASSFAFLAELRRAFPFPIRRLQCDNGREFPLAFAIAVEAAGIRHRYIQPRRPQQKAYASYCTSLVGCGADLLRRTQAESPFHL
jgi:hypothetical protein